LRATRRRTRRSDQLASADSVLAILDELRTRLPGFIPSNFNDLRRLLRAVRHLQRYPASDTRRGRPSRWRREDLLSASLCLSEILDRETSGRISVATFIDHYVQILDFPVDIQRPLTAQQINLFEAEQLCRISDRALSIGEAEALRLRTELLSTHLKARLSGERLRMRINELLGRVPKESTPPVSIIGQSHEDLENAAEIDVYDASHLFWDEIQRLNFAFRDLQREDVSESDIEEFLHVCEPVWTVLNRIQKKKEKQNPPKPLVI
jgi:hypothetical protein